MHLGELRFPTQLTVADCAALLGDLDEIGRPGVLECFGQVPRGALAVLGSNK